MQYGELMAAFAAKFGISEVNAGEGAVVLDFNDIPVSFVEDKLSDNLLLHALIGEEPDFGDGTLATEALKANAVLRESAGAALCRDAETEKYAAVQALPLASLGCGFAFSCSGWHRRACRRMAHETCNGHVRAGRLALSASQRAAVSAAQ